MELELGDAAGRCDSLRLTFDARVLFEIQSGVDHFAGSGPLNLEVFRERDHNFI